MRKYEVNRPLRRSYIEEGRKNEKPTDLLYTNKKGDINQNLHTTGNTHAPLPFSCGAI